MIYITRNEDKEIQKYLESLNSENRLDIVHSHSIVDVKINRNGVTFFKGFRIAFEGKRCLKIYSVEHNLLKTIFNIDRGDIVRMDFHIEYHGDDVFPKVKSIRECEKISIDKPAIEIIQLRK